MKIIHCADLHLDSKMESNLSQDQAKLRRDELLDTFDRMVDYAAENRVQVVLIAGDLFDKQHIRKTAKARVLEAITKYSDIDFLYLKGNHDRTDFLDDLDQIPSNIKTFSAEEWTAYEYGDLVISGREMNKDNSRTIATNLILDRAKTNIVMLHGQESEYEGPDHTEIVNIPEFKNKNIDYLALGHIHSYKQEKLDDRGIYCYSGCLEGRGFDECDEKGFVLLDVEDGQISSSFVPFAKRMLHEVHVDVTPEMTMSDIICETGECSNHIKADDLIKFVLDGQTEMDFDIDIDRINRVYNAKFFFAKTYDHTKPLIDYDSFANDPTLKGEFVRLMQSEDMDEDERLSIIELGMKAIMGEEIEE